MPLKMDHHALIPEVTCLGEVVQGIHISGDLLHKEGPYKPSETGFGQLPRELRDEIYYHLLCKIYRVDLSAVTEHKGYSRSNPSLARRNRLPPSSSVDFHPHDRETSFPAPFEKDQGRAPWTQRSQSFHLFQNEDLMKPACVSGAQPSSTPALKPMPLLPWRWKIANAKDRLPITLTSKAIRQEALTVLYKGSTFLFSISSPRKLSLNPEAVKHMKKIQIHLDLLLAYQPSHSTWDQQLALNCGIELVKKFGSDQVQRQSCIISIDFLECSHFLRQPRFLEAMATLTRFKTVALKLTPSYQEEHHKDIYNDDRGRLIIAKVHRTNVAILSNVRVSLETVLGPCLPWPWEYYGCLIYHPQSHLTGAPLPKFDIDAHSGFPDRVTNSDGSDNKGGVAHRIAPSSLLRKTAP